MGPTCRQTKVLSIDNGDQNTPSWSMFTCIFRRFLCRQIGSTNRPNENLESHDIIVAVLLILQLIFSLLLIPYFHSGYIVMTMMMITSEDDLVNKNSLIH